ncbi:hypothetical protein T4E_11456 [Trichinella pseudospiralis]|uniref:Uncharacterized protein n=1 Tax=Trichinella pseudospiralis TaxID=6337 RepID=A0A0V0YA75_TRIPS|nr:hypothetical protein T4E_11456 [Trichinella pseudospiralis]
MANPVGKREFVAHQTSVQIDFVNFVRISVSLPLQGWLASLKDTQVVRKLAPRKRTGLWVRTVLVLKSCVFHPFFH